MALEENEVEQTKEEAPRERPDQNHVMMGGRLVCDNDFILSKTDSSGNITPLTGLRPDGTTGDLYDQRKIPVIDTASVDSFMGNFAAGTSIGPGGAPIPNDSSWNSQAGMSMDGMFIPYAAEFVTQGSLGSLTNIPIPSGCLPSFEKPVGMGNSSLTDWWNVDSGIITSATLNPLASGHGISLLVRNAKRTDLNVRKTGGGYALGSKRLGQTANITAIDLSESNQHARPIGLRGPLVVAGWGYDTEGFPVPNAKFEADRREALTMSGGGGVDNAGLPPELQFDKPRAHLHFLDSHLKRVDRWKSGPVDLRWDRERKVWVGGKFNGVYLSKAVKCILPQAGIDGKNSFNFGINNNITNPGRLYRNPCPQTDCQYETYFPTSNYYPDIEIYDPEDIEWCGNCEILNVGPLGTIKYVVQCTAFSTTCSPFYDAIIMRSVDHTVSGRNTYSSCGDKFSKTIGGEPHQRRAGDPCHTWGGSALSGPGNNIGGQSIHGIMPPVATGGNAKYAESAKAILYQKILIENPLNQGLMLGGPWLSLSR